MLSLLKQLLPLLVLIASLPACCVADEPAKLDGTWQITSVETRGRILDERQFGAIFEGLRWVIKDNSLTQYHGKPSGPVWDGTFTVDNQKTPAHFDWKIKTEQQEALILGIYERKDDVLRFCFAPIKQPRPNTFDTSKGNCTVYEFKRVDDRNENSKNDEK